MFDLTALNCKVIQPMHDSQFTDPVLEYEKAKKLDSNTSAVFLAGPCPRSDYEDDWRFAAIDYINTCGYTGLIFNPTNPEYDTNDSDYLRKQTAWEVAAMEAADKIVFWIPRDAKHPAFTTNIELGQFLSADKIDRIIIGMPTWGEKNEYIKVRLQMLGKDWANDLLELMRMTVKELQNKTL